MNNMSAVPLHPPPLSSSMSFSGDRAQFRWLATRGGLLELVTAGFYRFWLATDIRRHLWSNTTLDDDAFEYTGRGRELFIGFLFALAIIIPIYLGYFLVGLELERIQAFGSVPLIAFFYVFGQFAIFRARRYRLTRTVWRGVRFWMTGSAWSYAARGAMWAVLVLLTLGLILPWKQAALERYKMRHSHYGDLRGSFEGNGWEFFKQGWWLWLLAAASVMSVPIGFALLFKFFPALSPSSEQEWQIGLFFSALILLIAPFIYAAFKATQWRWWISGVRFGCVRLESVLTRGALVDLYWKFMGWLLLMIAIYVAYWFLCAALIASLNQTPMAKVLAPGNLQGSISMLVFAGIGYLALVLLSNVAMRVYLLRDIWVRVIGSTTIYGIEAAANVAAKGNVASAVGEGLADGLDLAGF